jgi:ubiquinone/menaquinone biosynthesis C-methylase UbiE
MHEAVSRPRGLGSPRLYDLLLLGMTRGSERKYRERLLDLAQVADGQSVLDIGCGTGTLAIAAWQRSQPNGSVYGIDISAAMIAAAQRKGRAIARNASLRFLEGAAVALPFPDGMFDTVMVVTMMHMLPEPERLLTLKEASRVLRPGGRLLFVDYGGAQRKGWVARHHLHRAFDLDSLKPMLADAGLAEADGGPLGWLSLQYLAATKHDAIDEHIAARARDGERR